MARKDFRNQVAALNKDYAARSKTGSKKPENATDDFLEMLEAGESKNKQPAVENTASTEPSPTPVEQAVKEEVPVQVSPAPAVPEVSQAPVAAATSATTPVTPVSIVPTPVAVPAMTGQPQVNVSPMPGYPGYTNPVSNTNGVNVTNVSNAANVGNVAKFANQVKPLPIPAAVAQQPAVQEQYVEPLKRTSYYLPRITRNFISIQAKLQNMSQSNFLIALLEPEMSKAETHAVDYNAARPQKAYKEDCKALSFALPRNITEWIKRESAVRLLSQSEYIDMIIQQYMPA